MMVGGGNWVVVVWELQVSLLVRSGFRGWVMNRAGVGNGDW